MKHPRPETLRRFAAKAVQAFADAIIKAAPEGPKRDVVIQAIRKAAEPKEIA